MKKFKLLQDKDLFRMIIVTIVIFAAMAALRPNLFLKSTNFVSMGYQLPELGLYTIAFMIVLVTGAFNLAIVAVGNLCCIVGIKIMGIAVTNGYTGGEAWLYIGLAIVTMIALGTLCGFASGWVITYFNVPALVVTMSTASIFTGLAIILSKGESLSGVPAELAYFGNHTLLGLPYALWLLIIVFALTVFLLNYTKFGFELKFVGSNAKASHFTGIDTTKTIIKAYTYSGFVSSLCAVEILARTSAAKADYAATYLSQAILCSVLGATNPNGGYVRMSCIALSMLSLQFLSSGLNMMRLGGEFKNFTWGLLLIVVLSFDYINNEIKRRNSIRAIKKAHAQAEEQA